ncbi:MAG: sensor hybrid histidine kinase [Verrucomicrobia bacterium]|nr:sensor hybrid histidine kinase [Verrucomicrobiota bacterium]
MRRRFLWAAVYFGTCAAIWAAPRVRIGVENNAEPLSFVDAKGQPTGFSPELVRAMTKTGEFEAEFVSSSWSQILHQFNAGQIDVLANVTVTDERKSTMDFSISHAYLHGFVYFRDDRAPVRKTSDFAGKTVGVLLGSVTYFHMLSHPEWGARVQGYATSGAVLEATRSGEVDAALYLLPLATGTNERGLHSEFLDDVTFRYHFAVHKGDTATLARLNEALAGVRHDGEFDRLWSKWIGPLEPHPIRAQDLRPYFIPLAIGLAIMAALFSWQRRMLSKVSAQAVALRESEDRFRSTFENAGAGMALVRTNGELIRTNPILQRMLGYTDAELTRLTFREITHAEDLEKDLTLFDELLVGRRESYQIEKRYIRKDRRIIWGRLTISSVRGRDGAALYTVGMVEDVTEHKRTQDALRLSQERLQAILDYSPALIYVKNLEGRYLLTNRLFNEKNSKNGASLVGLTIRALVPPEEADLHESHDRLVIDKGAPITMEEKSLEKGVMRTYLAVKFPLRDAQGRIYAIGGVDTDITEYQVLQAQFVQAQKMEAFGQLAGGIAHDFNNILAVFMIQLSLLSADATLPALTVKKLKGLEDITQKAARLTRQLLMFSRREATSMQVMDLNQALVEVFKMLGRVLGEHIDLKLQHQGLPRWINADAGMIEQVVMNLCVNARDAMPEGGRLLVDTEIVEFDAGIVHETRRPGRFVCLSVADTGQGMEAATIKRIFEPFFTTKEVGKGTGLGLATVYGIVKQHGGWVEVASAIGQGSVFRVYLPSVGPAAVRRVEAEVPEVRGGRERILIVEDDAPVREISAMCLEQMGYSVVVTSDAAQGMQKWEEHGQRFDLLLTDMVMPGGMSGLKLARMLKEMKQSLKVIIVSGYSAEASDSKKPFTDVGIYLTKPINRVTLLAAVRKALDSP